MDRKRFRWIESAALSDPKPVTPQLTWGHVMKIDGRTVVAASNGYRIHAVWDEGYQHLVGHIFPYSFSVTCDRVVAIDPFQEQIHQVAQYNLWYKNIDSRRLWKLLKGIDSGAQITGVWLISRKNRLYLSHEFGITELAYGAFMPDGMRFVNARALYAAVQSQPETIDICWRSAALSAIGIGVLGEQLAVVMPLDESRADKKEVFRRASIIIDAMVKADNSLP